MKNGIFKNNVVRNLALLAAAAGFCVCAAEFFLYIVSLPTDYIGAYRIDERFGLTHTPRAKLRYHGEGHSFDSFNKKGLRDFDYPYQKPLGVKRILVLGDSYTEGLQVPLTNTYCKLLEKRLNKDTAGGTKWEVINAGVQGYGSAQQFIFLTLEGYKYNPDYVLMGYFANDIASVSFETEELLFGTASARQRPYLALSNNSFVVERSAFNDFLQEHKKQRIRRFFASRRITVLASRFLVRTSIYSMLVSGKEKIRTPKPLYDNALFYYMPDEMNKDLWSKAAAVQRNIFREIKKWCDTRQVAFLLANIPGPLSYRELPDVKNRFADSIGSARFDQEYQNTLICTFAEQEHIPFIDLLPAFTAFQEKDSLDFITAGSQFECHLDTAGHALIAEVLYRNFQINLTMVKK